MWHTVLRVGAVHALDCEDYHALDDWPKNAVSDRANVSKAVLDKHHDQRSAKKKMGQWREYLDGL